MSATPNLYGPYEIHPLADLFPAESDSHIELLSRQIRREGLLSPIVRHRDRIIDGRSRLRACLRINSTPHFTEYLGDPEDLAEHIWALQFTSGRHNLNESQRAAIAVGWYHHQAQEHQKSRATFRWRDATITPRPLGTGHGRRFEYRPTLRSLAAVSWDAINIAIRIYNRDTRTGSALLREIQSGNLTLSETLEATPTQTRKVPRETRTGQISDLAKLGYTSQQIAVQTDTTEEYVRSLAKEEGITITADAVVGKRRRVNIDHIMEQTILDVLSIPAGITTLSQHHLDNLKDHPKFHDWISRFDEAVDSLRSFSRDLKKARRTPQ